MAAAFRSVPIYLNICREIEKSAPDAILMNHANPMAVLCRAMNKHSAVRCVIGICHGVQIGITHAARILGVEPHELDTAWIGTNHYYWFTRIRHRGKDLLPELWKRAAAMDVSPTNRMSYELSLIYGHWITYPADDHIIEFYPFLAQAGSPDQIPYGMGGYGHGAHLMPYYRGETTVEEHRKREASVRREDALKSYADSVLATKLPTKVTDPVLGEGTARLIADIATGRRGLHILNIPNRCSVPNLPSEAVLEVESVTDSCGVRPLYMDEAPLALEGLLRKRIAWQEMVVEAAVTGDRNLALQAMMLDDQAIPPGKSVKLLDELLQNSKGMLPQFGLGE
jgi:alpha-galactosidase